MTPSSNTCRAECPMTSALIHRRGGCAPLSILGSRLRAEVRCCTRLDALTDRAFGREHREPGVPTAFRCVMAAAQAGLFGARVNPGGAAQLKDDAAFGEVWVRDTPIRIFRCPLIRLLPRRMGAPMPNLRLKGPRMNRRRSPRPLAPPAFGSPADGIRCRSCGQWFHRSHFWRRTTRSFVQRCADCIRQDRRSQVRAR